MKSLHLPQRVDEIIIFNTSIDIFHNTQSLLPGTGMMNYIDLTLAA